MKIKGFSALSSNTTTINCTRIFVNKSRNY